MVQLIRAIKHVNAQGAIEFALMFGVMLFFFLGLLAYLNISFGEVSRTTEVSKNNAELQSMYDKIFQTWRSPVNYVTTVEYFPFNPETDRSLFFQTDITDRVREIVAIDSLGNQQLLFIPNTMTFVAQTCSGTHELTRTHDGVGLCCESCNGTLPGKSRDNSINCQQNYSSYNKLGYMRDCENMQAFADQTDVILHAVQAPCTSSGYINVTIDNDGTLHNEVNFFNITDDFLVDTRVFDEDADSEIYLQNTVDITAECYRRVTANSFVLDTTHNMQWFVS